MIGKKWRVRIWPVTQELTLGFDRLKTTPDRSALAAGCTTTLSSKQYGGNILQMSSKLGLTQMPDPGSSLFSPILTSSFLNHQESNINNLCFKVHPIQYHVIRPFGLNHPVNVYIIVPHVFNITYFQNCQVAGGERLRMPQCREIFIKGVVQSKIDLLQY